MKEKSNIKKKSITVRLERELWQKTRRVLFEKNQTFQDFAEQKFRELITV